MTIKGIGMSKKKAIKFSVNISAEELMKESQEQRKARVQNSKPMGTRIEQNKRKYNRKRKHKKDWKDYA
jgi:hypothetical protein